MSRTIRRMRAITIFTLVVMVACVEPFAPPLTDSNANFLVVDGFLNGSTGSASILLTRAIPLSINVPNPPEEGADVSIESVTGATFDLAETKKGIYEADGLAFDASASYRLHIATTGGKSYTSDYIMMRRSPVLDSVSWRGEETGTRLYVSGHDPLNQTTFYRYLFTDIWEYNVAFYSYFRKVDGKPVVRDLTTEQVYRCWNSSINTEVLTVSTKRLQKDVVSMLPINFIRKGSRMLSHIYSIKVQQRAISQEEYEYWDLIKRTTENLGGLFDPLPSQVLGNVHNDNDPSEQVLGYFSGGFVQEKRIFIANVDLPPDLRGVDPYDFACEVQSIPYDQPELVGTDIFLSTIGIPPTAWAIGTPNCSDCTTLGGTTIKPDYWPQ